jgi:hypothetical protein
MKLIMPQIQIRYEEAALKNFKHYRRSTINQLKIYLDKHYEGVYKYAHKNNYVNKNSFRNIYSSFPQKQQRKLKDENYAMLV